VQKLLEHPYLPKPGRVQGAKQAEQATVEFRQARQWHPGVESAIGAWQSGNGINRCRDQTSTGYRTYVALGVLGRNLFTLGKRLIQREAPKSRAASSKRKSDFPDGHWLCPLESDQPGCTGSAETVPITLLDDGDCWGPTVKNTHSVYSPEWLEGWVSPWCIGCAVAQIGTPSETDGPDSDFQQIQGGQQIGILD
jgi:hypothetical protein